MNLSVILPTYNESTWLPQTLQKLDEAIGSAEIKKAEVLVVDDGSTDDTKRVVEQFLSENAEIVYVRQKNLGRFMARKTGVDEARYDTILFIDSRVHISKGSLSYVANRMLKDPKKVLWNAHVHVEKKGNIYARFWDALVFIAWRKYFRNPREVSYGLSEFDLYPKGTTCFLAPRPWIKEAINKFSTNSKNLKTSNDDTLLIKELARKGNINISPSFSCTYFSRSTAKKFLVHAYHRGKVFVDGFLRRDGNRYFWPLVCFLALSALVLIGAVLFSQYIVWILLAIIFLWLGELLSALILGVPIADSLSLFILSPLFALYYGAGIWSATIRRLF